jgi:vacuolar-type H+-ATPase subunit I/STV1
MANWFGDVPEGDKWEMWMYGVIAPLPIIGLALLWIVSRHADLSDHRSTIILQGTDAVVLGLTALCLALALHFHYYWRLSENPKLNGNSSIGTSLSLVGAMIGLLSTTWCFVRLFLL